MPANDSTIMLLIYVLKITPRSFMLIAVKQASVSVLLASGPSDYGSKTVF
jgi:hypothetical protein